jgi:outer membrane protein assembly factor BamB
MRTLQHTSLIVLLLTMSGCSGTPYDNELISNEKGLNFTMTDKRGIRGDNGAIYFVQQDGLTLTAYNNGETIWTVDFKKSCDIETPEIKGIELSDGKIYLAFGKHNVFGAQNLASVDIRDGKTTYRCRD